MLNRERRIRYERRSGPLQRFLEGNVSRPWDKVYSELCQRLKRNSYNDHAIREQVERLVQRDVCEVERQIFVAHGQWPMGRPLRPGQLYVCPRTGLLRKVRKRETGNNQKQAEPPVVKIDNTYQCHWRDGVWHLLTMVPLCGGKMSSGSRRDVWLNLTVGEGTLTELRKAYGGMRYAVAARPLAKHELRNWPIPLEWQ